MKKTFGILGAWMLLMGNFLPLYVNGVSCGTISRYDTERNGCYIIEHISKPDSSCRKLYSYSKLVAYKCDAEGGIVDLRDVPLGSGQYIAEIGEDAFSGTNVTKVIMPSTIEYIGDGAFCSVKRVGEPMCGNNIIESGEQCDDGNSDDGNGYTRCGLDCRIMDLPNCGNGQRDPLETCGNCQEDLACGKSVGSSDSNESPESELLFKAELPVGEYDDSNFVEVDFPDGMNDEFDIEDLDYSCAKLHEYTVTFKTESGEFLGTGETQYQYLSLDDVPSVSDREGFIGGWYLGDEIFDFSEQIKNDIVLTYKYKKGGIEYDGENGWIKVSLGDKEIIVKDRNQRAEKTFNEVESDDDLINAAGNYYFWGNNTGLNLKEIVDENGSLDNIENLPEGFDHGYVGLEGGDDWNVGSKDTPCNPASGEYLPGPDDWKLLMQLWGKINGYEVMGDEMGYFFNDFDIKGGEGKSLNLLMSDGFSSYNGELAAQINNGYLSAIEKFSNDLYILLLPSLNLDNGGINFLNGLRILPSALNGGKIGYFMSNGLMLSNISNLYGFENDTATPIRCFVRPQFEVMFDVNGGSSVELQKIFSGDNAIEVKTQKENAEFLGWYTVDGKKFNFSTPITSDVVLYAKWQDNKLGNGYSGGGGSSSSKTTKTVDKEHTSDEDKADSSLEKTSKEVQNVDNNEKGANETVNQAPQKRVTYVPDNTLPEMEQAYNFARSYGITSKTSVENAKMDGPLTRIQMAKILSNYAMNVLGEQPDISKGMVRFNDVTTKMDKDYGNAVTLSYQLGIMGINMPNNKFRPNDEVSRAEFVTALSRLLYNTSDGEYESTPKYYTYHMEKLQQEGVIMKIDPKMKEKRGYVMLMLMRTAE